MPIKVLRVVFLLLYLDFFSFFRGYDRIPWLRCSQRVTAAAREVWKHVDEHQLQSTSNPPGARAQEMLLDRATKSSASEREGEKMKRRSLRSVCCYVRVRIRVFVFESRKQCTCPGGQVAVPHPNYSCEPQ